MEELIWTAIFLSVVNETVTNCLSQYYTINDLTVIMTHNTFYCLYLKFFNFKFHPKIVNNGKRIENDRHFPCGDIFRNFQMVHQKGVCIIIIIYSV